MRRKGPKLFISLTPCPTGWHFEPKDTLRIATLATKTGIWPLKEYENGRVIHSKFPQPVGRRPPVGEYLKLQGRFAHLFQPERNEKALSRIQARVDRYWEDAA